MNINDRMDRVETYRARQDTKRAIVFLSVIALISGIIINVFAVISSSEAVGMTFYEVAPFETVILMFQHNLVLFILSAVFFFAGLIGIIVNHIR